MYRAEATASRFGIATVDWSVPARLRLGSYTISATSKSDTDRTSATSIRISRYDLPTFTVTPKPDRPFYLPGQDADVSLHADYLFGKPVLHGHVRVVREDERVWNNESQRYDAKEGAVFEGELDSSGKSIAHISLAEEEKQFAPDSRKDNPNGFADLHFAAYLTDASTGRTEQRRFDIRISAQPLHINVLRDATYPAGLPLGFFVAATTADGLPAPDVELHISLEPARSGADEEPFGSRLARSVPLLTARTNRYGLARVDGLPVFQQLLQRRPAPFQNKPSEDDQDSPDADILVTAQTADGRAGHATEAFSAPSAALRITTPHSLYAPGDLIEATITSAQSDLPVTVQAARETHAGPVLLDSQNVRLRNGHATVVFHSALGEKPDPRYTGYISLTAFSLATQPSERNEYSQNENRSAEATRTVLFPRDNSLHVDVKLQRAVYQPGETASAAVSVKGSQDADGDDTAAAPIALGVVAVDQAVNERNRTNTDFGGSGSTFFLPWRSVFYGRSVADLSLDDLERLNPSGPFPAELDLAAAFLLDGNHPAPLFADNAPNWNLESDFSSLFNKQLDPVRKTLQALLRSRSDLPISISELDALLAPQHLSLAALRDPWDLPYRIAASPQYGNLVLSLVSDGPDKLPNTSDDVSLRLANWSWFARHAIQLRQVIFDYHQRNGGYIRDLPTLLAASAAQHLDLSTWRDPWEQPLRWEFPVEGPNFNVCAVSAGEPSRPHRRYDAHFNAGCASISWFTDQRLKIQAALNTYAERHPFPTTEGELDSALRAGNIDRSTLLDPWGHPLYLGFRTRTLYTDNVSVEAHGTPGGPLQKRTVLTPVTATVDTVELHSTGPNGTRGDFDDVDVASFSHMRAVQSAKDTTPRRVGNDPTRSGEPAVQTGGIAGTVNDASGAVIPNVTLVATNTATHVEFETRSEADGAYLFATLPAGVYTVRIQTPGFQVTEINEVHVLAPETIELNVTLQVGAASETVEVTAGSVTVNAENASLALAGFTGGAGGRIARGANFDRMPGYAFVPQGPPPPPPPSGTPRVRDYFPETLLWRPEVLTSQDGTATIRFPVADSITAWQVSVAASTLKGNTGAGISGFRTQLPFFAALDPPETLTVGDALALPITLRNYLDHPVTVASSLTATNWLRIDSLTPTTQVAAQDSASPIAHVTATAPIAEGKLRFTALPSGARGDSGDSIERTVTVHPDGKEAAATAAAVVTDTADLSIDIPADVLPGGNDATVKLYPNLAAHLREALGAVSRFPGDCAEQIISTAWPTLLLERYAARFALTDKPLTAADRHRLEGAYANLLMDRNGDGGFRYWPTDTRSDLALTAYAIQFLTAARAFIVVDEDVIKRAVAYVSKSQTENGSWITHDRDGKAIADDTDASAMLTASIAAMLAGAPDAEPVITKALAAAQPFTDATDEPYTLAGYALAALAVHDTGRSTPAITRLRSLALKENGGTYWNLETNTPFFGWGRAGRVESTAQTLRALLASGASPSDSLVSRGLLFLEHQQDRYGLWYSTQSTARALDVMAAIALGSHASASAATSPADLSIRVDSQPPVLTHLPKNNKDNGPVYIPLGAALTPGQHHVTISLPHSSQPATAQLVASYFTPWAHTSTNSAAINKERLSLSVRFSSTAATPSTPVHAVAHIERIGFRGYGMLIAEIGLPPGADVDRASLESAVAVNGFVINHYEVLPDRLLLYLWPRAGGTDVPFTFTLRYGIDALTAPSAVYDYYNPDARFDLPPTRFTSPR